MVNAARFLTSYFSAQIPFQGVAHEPGSPKSVAIIGAGSAGLAMLQTLLDLPESLNQGWTFTLFEEREDVGGVWLPDPRVPSPPEIPKTPLYPLLHTNTPVPFMAYPGFPFLPGTPIYPSHPYIQAYHARYAKHYKLLDHIQFNHKLENASWVGNSEKGFWNLTISGADAVSYETFGHLVVASGNHHIPRIVKWKGEDEWLRNGPHAGFNGFRRQVIHSVYYREPEAFTNRTVVIVGTGASGEDIASQIVGLSNKTFISARHPLDDNPVRSDPIKGVEYKPDISHFTAAGIVFVDGTIVNADTLLLATGYIQSRPFLERGGILRVDPSARDNSSFNGALTSNLRYIFPLYQHILSLSSQYPTNALAFIGLPTYIANCPSDIAQSLFAAYAITKPNILPGRDVLLAEVAAYEENVRAHGLDPYSNGHKMLPDGSAEDYQDDLVEFLKDKGVLPHDGRKYVEQWRKDTYNHHYLKRGWLRIEKLGTGHEWTKDIKTEADWADLMTRVNEWQKQWEEENGIVEAISDASWDYMDY